MTRSSAVVLCLPAILAACAAPSPMPALNATAWAQTAAEHGALCRQVYRAATQAALAAPAPAGLPRAVIVDVDETVLDNGPYQARLLLDGEDFAPASWTAWCEEAQAVALPGAVAFADACQTAGITVFYITNRDAGLEAPTRRNLAEAGFPLADRDGVDVVLCRGEVGGGGNKQPRREHVGWSFTVVAMLGDDLGDFVEPAATVAERRAQVEAHADEWGARWFVLPNAMYGSWERVLTGGAAPWAAKRAALDPRR